MEVLVIKNEIKLMYLKILKWLGISSSFLGYIAGSDKLPPPLEEKDEIESYQKDIEEISKSINSYKNTKESYLNDVSIPFARLLSYEKKLTKISSKRWHEFAKEKDAMLIHFLHPIHKLSDDMHRICTSLYTKDLLNHVCSYLHIGYFYDYS